MAINKGGCPNCKTDTNSIIHQTEYGICGGVVRAKNFYIKCAECGYTVKNDKSLQEAKEIWDRRSKNNV